MIEKDHAHISDQDTEQRRMSNAIRRLIRKLDLRLIPFIVVLEVSSSVNRNCIGMCYSFEFFIANNIHLEHAQLMGFQSDLGMSKSESRWATAIFFLAYVRK